MSWKTASTSFADLSWPSRESATDQSTTRRRTRHAFLHPNNRTLLFLTFLLSTSASIQAQPTVGPATIPPTSSPSLAPVTSQPTSQPITAPPSRQPTSRPTNPPTGLPTSTPTFRPTGQPSHSPSRQPSPAPSSSPSLKPSRHPSLQPSGQPSPSPSHHPSIMPSDPPSVRPSSSPSESPSNSPSNTPSAKPSVKPSSTPSISPSDVPSSAPSESPSSKPSARPSFRPSTQPTLSTVPSTVPSFSPSSAPSSEPSAHPTSMPSSTPSATPSAMPSQMPSLPMQEFDISVSMKVLLSRELDFGERIDFEEGIAEHILNELISADFGDAPLLNLDVASDIVDVTIVTGDTLNDGSRQFRHLQSSEVLIEAFVRVRFQSLTRRTNEEVEGYVGEAFNSATERGAFQTLLSQKDNFFASMSLVEVLVAGEAPEEEVVDDSEGSNNTMYIIIGAAGGGFMALVALGLLAFRRSTSDSFVTPEEVENIPIQPEMEEGGGGGVQGTTKGRVSTEILVNGQDEVSTLGDPVFGHAGGMMTNSGERDEQTASVGNDYDYTKQYLRAQGLASLGESRERLSTAHSFEKTSSSQSGSKLGGLVAPSVFSDDVSFEQQFGFDATARKFEVRVPPGKLGMVIDTPNGGVPVVHAIKAESVLADDVKVGDRLVAVDGDDVTAMTAVQVSKLISLKSDQQRNLAFVRNGDFFLGDE